MLDRIRSELNQQAARQPAGDVRATLSPIARAAHERLMRDGVLKLCESPKASFTMSVNPGSIYLYVNCNGKSAGRTGSATEASESIAHQ